MGDSRGRRGLRRGACAHGGSDCRGWFESHKHRINAFKYTRVVHLKTHRLADASSTSNKPGFPACRPKAGDNPSLKSSSGAIVLLVSQVKA